ncbi:MAG TPA: hypothetical protein VEB20_17245 [Azospirillaceae bacterium]|nr:hypothetical protein [Azospirillaceae bacterium]
MSSPADELQECYELYLRGLSEPRTNALRILVEEALPGAPLTPEEAEAQFGDHPIGPLLVGSCAVTSQDGCRTFEIEWASYVAYSVTNETYAGPDEYEEFTGKRFRTYSRSRFRDYLKIGTTTSDKDPGLLTHWQILCGYHIIDVVSHDAPAIRFVGERR